MLSLNGKVVNFEKNINELITKKDSERIKTFNDFKSQFATELNDRIAKLAEWLSNFDKQFTKTVSDNLKEINESNIKSFNEIKANIDKHFEDTLTKHIKEQFGNIQSQMDKVGKEMVKFEQMQAKCWWFKQNLLEQQKNRRFWWIYSRTNFGRTLSKWKEQIVI